MRDRTITLLLVLAGVVLILLALVYWAEPAKSLPSLLPGHEAGSEHHHVKHGLAALFVGLAALAYAWFATGPAARSAS